MKSYLGWSEEKVLAYRQYQREKSRLRRLNRTEEEKRQISEKTHERRKSNGYYANRKKRKRSLKEQCVKYKGGKCERCGLVDDPVVYDFHHRDPAQKDFQISDRNQMIFSQKIQYELEKCDLLCSNCHRKEHHLKRTAPI